ncbi:MAG TPA: general stress protein [Bryobacteraceae bacterium]|nr:general stress protein [Bryobacteraceae bacterium]
MPKTVIGVFNTYHEAESAVHELASNGLPQDKVSVIAAERTRDRGSPVAVDETTELTAGAGTGAAVGGAAGLMFGIAALALPGIGPIVAAGPIAAALTGAGLGAAAGGLIGGLAKMGVPAEHAEQYQDAVRRGHTLVAIQAADADADRVESILSRHGAIDIDERSEQPHAATARRASDPHTQAHEFGEEGRRGAAAVERPVPPVNLAVGRTNVRFYDPDQSAAPDLADAHVRQLYDSEWRAHCSWEDFSDAWRFGSSLAVNGRYSSADWSDVEADARRHWETSRPNSWEKTKDIIRHAWDHVRGRH